MKKFNILLFAIISTFNVFSQTYVATTGNDTSGKGTVALPYKTIKKAVAVTAAGGTILVNPGTYAITASIYINKPLTIQKLGTNPVILECATWKTTNAYVIGIVNTSNVTIDGLTIQNKIGNGCKGIWVLDNASATANLNTISIKNCVIKNIGWISNNLSSIPANSGVVTNAIRVDGQNATYAVTNLNIEANDVSNCATGWGEAISLVGNINGFTIKNNKVYQIANIGIVVAGNYGYTGILSNNQSRNGFVTANTVYNCMSAIANSAGIYFDGAANCTMDQNIVYNSGIGIAVEAEQDTNPVVNHGGAATGNSVHNNLCYNNVVCGGLFGGVNDANFTSSIQNTSIFNNTFYNNRTGAVINGVTKLGGIAIATFADIWGGEVHIQNSDATTFENNILYATNLKKTLVIAWGYTISNFVSDYNLYYRNTDTVEIVSMGQVTFNGVTYTGVDNDLAGWTALTGQDIHSVSGLPGFVNAAGLNYNLTTTAFASDKGDVVYNPTYSGTTDITNSIRKRNGRTDMGCYELQTGATARQAATIKKQKSIFAIYPNPASEELNVNFENTINHLEIKLIDLNGRVVFNKKFKNSDAISINLSNMNIQTKMILLEISADNQISNHKILLK